MTCLVSVIIPVYNGERYLRDALDSVLAQTYQSVEILVIDDGSIDQTATIAKDYTSSIRYHYQPNQGTATARNYGMQLAQGEMFAFLDADDVWLPSKLALQVAAIQSQTQLEAIFGQACQSKEIITYNPSLAVPTYLPTTMLIDRAAMARVGDFSASWQVEWAQWYLRAKSASLITKMLPNLVAIRRIHGENKGVTGKTRAMREYLQLLKTNLDLRRVSTQFSDENDFNYWC